MLNKIYMKKSLAHSIALAHFDLLEPLEMYDSHLPETSVTQVLLGNRRRGRVQPPAFYKKFHLMFQKIYIVIQQYYTVNGIVIGLLCLIYFSNLFHPISCCLPNKLGEDINSSCVLVHRLSHNFNCHTESAPCMLSHIAWSYLIINMAKSLEFNCRKIRLTPTKCMFWVSPRKMIG